MMYAHSQDEINWALCAHKQREFGHNNDKIDQKYLFMMYIAALVISDVTHPFLRFV